MREDFENLGSCGSRGRAIARSAESVREQLAEEMNKGLVQRAQRYQSNGIQSFNMIREIWSLQAMDWCCPCDFFMVTNVRKVADVRTA